MGFRAIENNSGQRTRSTAFMAALFTRPDQFRSMDNCRYFRLEGSELVALVDDLLGIVCLISDGQRIRVFGLFSLEVWHLYDRHLLPVQAKFPPVFCGERKTEGSITSHQGRRGNHKDPGVTRIVRLPPRDRGLITQTFRAAIERDSRALGT